MNTICWLNVIGRSRENSADMAVALLPEQIQLSPTESPLIAVVGLINGSCDGCLGCAIA